MTTLSKLPTSGNPTRRPLRAKLRLVERTHDSYRDDRGNLWRLLAPLPDSMTYKLVQEHGASAVARCLRCNVALRDGVACARVTYCDDCITFDVLAAQQGGGGE